MPPEDAGIKHVDNRAGGIERRFDQRAGAVEPRVLVTERRRMNEQCRAPAVELGPNRLEARIAQINAVVIALDREALAIELIHTATQLGERLLRFAQRQLREEAEAFGILCDQRCAMAVRGDDGLGGLRSVVREQLRRDPCAVHEIDAGRGREFPFALGIIAGRPQRDDVEMSAHINPIIRHRILQTFPA
jgi:hypothetical protein